ncbi:glycosyltransferase [candidate division KSB3 bacterium]|nr:glycosyltransferase [candidate division KSB3 bacterium]
MNDAQPLQTKPRLIWVYAGSLSSKLDASTWLAPTLELRGLGWNVTLVAPGPSGYQIIKDVEVLCISKPRIYLLGQAVFHVKVFRFIIRKWFDIDVILFHSMSAPWILPLRFLRCFRHRRAPLLVMDTRTLSMTPRSRESGRDRLRRRFHKLMNRLANFWADGQLTITQHMAEAVHIPSEKLWGVWPSGVNVERFASAQIDRRWPLVGEPIHLIYIGVLHYERNLMTLSKAVEKANTEGMAFALSLVGDGTEREDLEGFAEQTDGRVRVIPPVPHEQVWELLAQAHVGVLPFPDGEKFRVSSPIKLFEYMAAGLPILATRVVCHTDVIGNGDYVFWAEQADVAGLLAALRFVWRDSDLLSKMGGQSATAARSWTWRESAKKLKKALDYGIAKYGRR